MEEIPIIPLLRGTHIDQKKAIHHLLEDSLFEGKVRAYVLKNSGTEDEGMMIFHDTIIAFAKYVFKNRDFKLNRSPQSYMMGTAKNLWITELRKKGRQLKTAEMKEYGIAVNQEDFADQLILKTEKGKLLKDVLDMMKIRCKEVLMYWAGGYKMVEIATLLGYKSEGVARKKKSECMKELYQFLEGNPHIKRQMKAY